MNMSRTFFRSCAVALILLVGACAYPVSDVSQGSAATAIYFDNAPMDARVVIDGEEAGYADRYDGIEAALAVTPGRHMVELKVGGTAVFRREYYLDDGVTLKIDVR